MPYFAFFYFGNAGNTPPVDVPGSIYFAPTYWTQSYFPANYWSILAIDITTTGRQTGQPHRIEIVFHNVGGRIFVSGMPGVRRSNS